MSTLLIILVVLLLLSVGWGGWGHPYYAGSAPWFSSWSPLFVIVLLALVLLLTGHLRIG